MRAESSRARVSLVDAARAVTTRQPLGVAALLVLAVIVTWLPALGGSFQFDDWNVIVDDWRVRTLAAWWESMPGTRALTKLSYAANHELGGGPAAFRAVNVAFHALNVLLVYALLRRLGAALRLGARSALVATTATLAFALHPVQTESVTYVAGRSNVLMATFALVALLAWWRQLDGGAGFLHRARWGVAVLLALCGALAAKETAAVLPAAMALVAHAANRASTGAAGAAATGAGGALARRGVRASRWPLALLPAVVLVVVALAAAVAYLPYDYLLRTSLATRSPFENLVAQLPAIGWLLGQLVFWGRLNADPALAPVTTLTPATAFGAAALVAVVVLALLNLRRRPALAFGVLWTCIWLAPTNSLLARLDLVNDRQWYLAIVGPAWLLGLGLVRALDFVPAALRTRVATGVLVAFGLALVAGTVDRNRVYATEITFWTDVLAKSPHNSRAANNLGIAYAHACQPAAAADAFARAMRLAPDDPLPAINRELLLQGELPGVPAECPGALPSGP